MKYGVRKNIKNYIIEIVRIFILHSLIYLLTTIYNIYIN